MAHPFDWVIPYYKVVSREAGWDESSGTEKISRLRARIIAHPPQNVLSSLRLVEWWDEIGRWATILQWLEDHPWRK